MKGTMLTLGVDGSITRKDYDGATPQLRELQSAVGGHIEKAPYFDTFPGLENPNEDVPAVVYIDGEGKLKDKPVNTFGTTLWAMAVQAYNRKVEPRYRVELVDPAGFFKDVLVGDIVVLMGDADWMKEL